MKKVFVSMTSFAEEDARPLELLKKSGLEVHGNPHARKLTEDEMMALLYDKDYLIAGTEPITKKVIAAAQNLKVISRCGVGLDNVDLKAADAAGIKVYNTPYGPTLSVAELTVGLMLDLMRMVSNMDRDVRAGIWKKRMGNLLKDKRVGIVGFGRIGQKVCELLQPFTVEVSYYDVKTVKTSPMYTSRPMEELLKWADIITIHCVASNGGKPIIGNDEMRMMRRGSWLVNTSRGGLVDESALYELLKEGHISGAALDVFEKEPYSGPLAGLDNVILTLHIGSYAKEARIKMEIDAVENLLAGLKCCREDKNK